MNPTISDPFCITNDAKMPFLAAALDPNEVMKQFQNHVPVVDGLPPFGIRVVRYKAQRRCLIEYDFQKNHETITLLGKVRANHVNDSISPTLFAFMEHGFESESEDGISVPKPVGFVPNFQMALQLKVTGIPSTNLFLQREIKDLPVRIAKAIHKIHRANIASGRMHTMENELRILHDRLEIIARRNPTWKSRIDRLLRHADLLGSAIPESGNCGIHRDFYSDQIIVDGSRLFILDFDLYCMGDPALDAGNFIGHLIELGLRVFNNPDAFQNETQLLRESFLTCERNSLGLAIDIYIALTLVRHVYISNQFEDRKHVTETLLDLSEQRVADLAGSLHKTLIYR